MESDPESLALGVKVFALISAIPIFIFALWADHIENKQLHASTQKISFDAETEIEKLRFLNLLVILFQFIFFLRSEELRNYFPIGSNMILVLCVSLELTMLTSTEKKLLPTPPHYEGHSKPLVPIILKTIRSWLMIAASCVLSSVACATVFQALANRFQISSFGNQIIITAGTTVGLVSSLIVHFALIPFHLCKILPHSTLRNLKIRAQIDRLFTAHELRIPNIAVVNMQKTRIFDALLIGLAKGRGPFRYTLFMSKQTLELLTEKELASIVSLQMSHFKLKHIQNRFTLTFSLALMSGCLGIITGLTLNTVWGIQETGDLMAQIVGLISLIISIHCLMLQYEKQSLEAGIYALNHFKIDLTDLATALRKMDYHAAKEVNPAHTKNLPLMGLPDTERRIFLWTAYYADKHKIASNSDKNSLAS
jgi:Zn-dependent protease with chaperone function